MWRWAINKADGTPLLFVSSQTDADKYHSRSDLEVFPVYRQPTHSITAAELERLRGLAKSGAMLGHENAYKACLKIDAALTKIIAAIAAEGEKE